MKKLILMIMVFCSAHASAYEIEAVAAPKNSISTQSTPIVRYAQPNSKRMIIFIPGGLGHYVLPKEPIDDSKGFLALLKSISTASNTDVAIAISPYPLKVNPNTWYPYMRDTEDHLNRIDSVVRQYQKTHEIWLMGHSHGTSSITAFMRHLEMKKDTSTIKGLLMISTGNTAQFDRSPEVPVLFVHHAKDACPGSTFEIAQSNFKNVHQINSRNTKLVTINNDISFTFGDPCYSGYHMLHGAHAETTSAIVNFIKESQ